MTDPVYTQAQLDAVRKAYASGVTRVTYDGKTTEYRSLDEMARIINTIESDLSAASTPRRARQVRFRTDRGLNGKIC